MSRDIVSGNRGVRILFATSDDERYPPSNMLDGSGDTFWATTGMYPQQFIIAFPTVMDITSTTVQCYNVKTFELEKSSNDEMNDFKQVELKELDHHDRQLQVTTFDVRADVRFLRFTIHSGHDYFCSVHNLRVIGKYLD